MRLETCLEASAGRFGDRTALVAGALRLTHAELEAASGRLASGLVGLGIRPGDRIALMLDNCAEVVIAFFAIWKAGAIACPLHATMKSAKLAAILASIDAAAVVTQPNRRATVDTAIDAAIDATAAKKPLVLMAGDAEPEQGGDAIRLEALMDSGPAHPLPQIDDGQAPALIIHTSGSTGEPKGVVLSHGNVLAACRSITAYLNNDERDVVLNVLPLSHGYGITQIVTMVMAGGTLVLEKSFAFPRAILQRLREERVTGFPLVPPMAALIAGMKDLEPGFLPDLRYITSAAAAMPETLGTGLQRLFPAAQLFLMYGQTECLRTSFLAPEDVARRPLSVGKPIPGTVAHVVDDMGRPVAPGVIGELVVEGPHVMLGYWQDAAASLRKLTPAACGRRLYTGDLFRQDAEGFLYFVSRRDDIIKTRGEKVSPQEVENVLYALAGIREAAVGGVEDAVMGQVIRAHVVLEEGSTLNERDIIRHCAAHLEDYMVPKSVEFRDALPRTATGKIRLGAEASNSVQQGHVA